MSHKSSSTDATASWCSLSSMKLRIAEIRKDPEATKILSIKLSLVGLLIVAALAVSINTYSKLHMNQQRAFDSSFSSVGTTALTSVVDSFDRVVLSIQQLSSTYSEMFPEPEQWPYVAWNGFSNMVIPLGKISSVQGLAIFPIVHRNETQNFTNHLYEYYAARPAKKDIFFPYWYPNGAIWAQNETALTATTYEVTSGITPPRDFFTPMLQYSLSDLAGEHYAGYDLRSSHHYGSTVDAVLACTHGKNFSVAQSCCGAFSDVVSIPYAYAWDPRPTITDMMALFVQPIYAADDPNTVVGLAAGTLSWATVLARVAPSYVGDIDCVVHTPTGYFTFTIADGIPRYRGKGDLHNSAFSELQISSGTLNENSNRAVDVAAYTLTFYPTQNFHDKYFNWNPIQSALVMVSIFALCSFLFYIYDYRMKREFSRRQAVLDTKRRFVRFISHEIRTPLNTVRLGLKLFEEELDAMLVKINRAPTTETSRMVKKAIKAWKGLTEEILESSDSAVEVLDDLLNYDKIEIGTLRLEFGLIDMCGLVVRCVAMMQVHAKQKGIILMLQCDMDSKNSNNSKDKKLHDHKNDDKAGMVTPFVSADEAPIAGAAAAAVATILQSLEEGCARAAVCSEVVVGDATRLSQVLRNLISNALKFTPAKGTVAVKVDMVATYESVSEKVRLSSPLFQCMHPAGAIRIAVTDSGAGLSPDQLAQICKEGVQFNANELQAGQGSGLGLFISKGIVEQHGGALSVSSEGLGKGVTFTIMLPLFKDETNHSGVRSLRSSIHGGLSKSPSALLGSGDPSMALSRAASMLGEGLLEERPLLEAESPRKVLVVDDSPFNRKMLVRLMTSKGFECIQAEDGADAVRVYQQLCESGETLDAIMMDFEMPVMNGPTATGKLRELGCMCLIIGVTGNVLPDQVTTFKNNGADAVLPKPLVLEDLQFLLNHCVHEQVNSQSPMRLMKKQDASTVGSLSTSFKIHPDA